jgi:hypothetical protein
MAGIINTLTELSGCDAIDGKDGVVGICGPISRFSLVLSCLGTMDGYNKWIAEVLATHPPLEPPLAVIHMPLEDGGTTERWKLHSKRMRYVLWDL